MTNNIVLNDDVFFTIDKTYGFEDCMVNHHGNHIKIESLFLSAYDLNCGLKVCMVLKFSLTSLR